MIKYQASLVILVIFTICFLTFTYGITFESEDTPYEASQTDGGDGFKSWDGRKHKVKTSFFSTDNTLRDLKCGQEIRNFDSRIVGGKMAAISDFPWMISLQREKGYWFGFKYYFHSCGGSLITPSWIVTAAHCVYDKEPFKRAVAGTDDMESLYRAQLRSIVKVIVHPKFEPETYNNDIALMKVNKPFNIQSKFSLVGTICLERDVPVVPYDIATIAGFGANAFHTSSKTHLYSTDIAIIDQNVCNISFDYAITDNMICAGGMISNKRDACSGDSGGPMQMENDGYDTLVGIVSFGNSCATQGFPGIYTRVGNYYDWILTHIDEVLYDP